MKILFVVGDYYERRAKYADIMREIGHDVVSFAIGKKKLGYKKATPKWLDGIDLVWSLKYDYVERGIIPNDSIKVIKKRNIPLVAMHTCGKGRTLKSTVKILKPYDLIFEHNEELAGRLNKIDKSNKFNYIPLGYHPDQYYPLDRTPAVEASFTGNDMNNRPKKLDLRIQHLKLARKNFKVKVYGKDLCRKMGLQIRPFNTHEKQRRIYAKTKVNLNFPWCNSMIPDFEGVVHANNRFFEITACNRLALTAYSPSLDNLLKEGKETFYYRNKKDMIDKTRYILENYDKLERVRETGMRRCLREHTFKHRIEKVFKIISEKL